MRRGEEEGPGSGCAASIWRVLARGVPDPSDGFLERRGERKGEEEEGGRGSMVKGDCFGLIPLARPYEPCREIERDDEGGGCSDFLFEDATMVSMG